MTAGAPATLISRIVQRMLLALFRAKGWRVEGGHPGIDKCIIVGAPHTSNWDFLYFLGVAERVGIRPNFIGKHSLFRWPIARFMRDMGGLAIDRSRSGGFVGQVVAEFGRARELALVMAPEGSRSSSGEWRTGFYHIAEGAGVAIVPGWFDIERGTGGLGEPIVPSGDYRADLAKLAAFYRAKMPDCDRFVALERMASTLEQLA